MLTSLELIRKINNTCLDGQSVIDRSLATRSAVINDG